MSVKIDTASLKEAVEKAGFRIAPAIPGGMIYWWRKNNSAGDPASRAGNIGGPFTTELHAIFGCMTENGLSQGGLTAAKPDSASAPEPHRASGPG